MSVFHCFINVLIPLFQGLFETLQLLLQFKTHPTIRESIITRSPNPLAETHVPQQRLLILNDSGPHSPTKYLSTKGKWSEIFHSRAYSEPSPQESNQLSDTRSKILSSILIDGPLGWNGVNLRLNKGISEKAIT